MQESIRDCCRLGIVHFMAWPECIRGDGPIVETVATIAEDADFDVLEVARFNDARVREEAVSIARQARLELMYAAQPAILLNGWNPNSLDEHERRRAVDALKAEIDIAYEIGAIGFAMLSGPDPGPADRAAATDALLRSLSELCDHAASLGDMPLVLEVFDRDVDKKALIGPTAEAVVVADRLNRAGFGLLVDLSHLPLQRESPRQALATARRHLRHAHIGNCVLRDGAGPVFGDQHPRFGYPGGENDVVQLEQFLRVLLDIGYLSTTTRPVLSFEIKPQPGESTRAIIANAKRTLAAAWSRV